MDQSIVVMIKDCAHKIDQRFPFLRNDDLESYTAKVAWMAHSINSNVGRKKSAPNNPLSKSTLGVLEGNNFVPVDFVRDESNAPQSEWWEKNNRNPIRVNPIVHPLVSNQIWVRPEEVEIETKNGNPTEEEEPQETFSMLLAKTIGILNEIKAQQIAQTAAINQAVIDLKQQIKDGIKIRF
jgi:hypothetical protein